MMPKTRVEAFTDAVIAIILTLLILELKIPEKADWSALTQSGHKIIIYLISFVTLLIYWNNHHHLFQVVHKINGRVLWANSFFVFALSLFPFATSWISEYINSLAPEMTYGFVTLTADIAYYILAKELVKANKGHEKALKAMLNNYKKSYLSIGLNVLGIVLGYLVAPVAVLIANIVILAAWIIPSRTIESQYR